MTRASKVLKAASIHSQPLVFGTSLPTTPTIASTRCPSVDSPFLADRLSSTGSRSVADSVDLSTPDEFLQSLENKTHDKTTLTEVSISGAVAKIAAQAAIANKSEQAIAASQCDTQVDRKTDLEAMVLEQAIADGNVDPRKGAGRRFVRELSKEDKIGYADCKGHEAKAAFRLQWAERKLQELNISRTHTKSYKHVDVTKGTYYSFGSLVESFGILYDRAAAIKSAAKHALKCEKMGGKWISYDELSETTEYYKLRREFQDIMAEKWSLCESESSVVSLKQDDADVDEPKTGVKDKPGVGSTPPAQKKLKVGVGSTGGEDTPATKKK
jgi:hypothetical protein